MSGGLLAFLAAGAAKGAGDGIVAEARAKREAAIAELANSRLESREQADRDFRSQEGQLDRASRAAETKTDRAYRASRDAVSDRQWTAEQKARADGSVPAGYRRTENGLEAIPGGPADASQPDPNFKPSIQSIYTEDGREQKGYFDRKGDWTPVGGEKAPSKGGGGVTIGPDGTIEVGASLPAEMGSRIGLGDAFLEDLPKVRKQIEDGEVSGPIERGQLAAGAGKPAAIWRHIESGKEALVRNLTGAGMSASEAANQAARYQISATDSKETMLDKLDGLERDLKATRKGAIGAKTGQLSASPPQADRDGGSGAATPGSTSSGVKWSVE